MTPDDDLERRVRANEQQVVRLDERMDYATADRDLVRREIRDSETRVLKAIVKVDEDCKDFRREVRRTWDERDETKRGVAIAWIGGACLLIAAIVNTIATLLT